MISYQWDTQDTMLRIKAELEAQGFIVWLDVERMEGSILETMARAVEKSSLLLLAVSRKYQNSPNCRSGSSILSVAWYFRGSDTCHIKIGCTVRSSVVPFCVSVGQVSLYVTDAVGVVWTS